MIPRFESMSKHGLYYSAGGMTGLFNSLESGGLGII